MTFADTKSRARGCLLTAGFFLLAPLIAYAFAGGYLPIYLFDSEEWKSVTRSDDYTRLRMVEPLLFSKRLDNLDRAQVNALLGPPNETPYFREWDYVYWLGAERGLLSLDSEWLVINFSDSGKVATYQVVSD